MKKLVLFIFLFSHLVAEQICLFTPPPKWKCADQKLLAKEVLVAFLGRGKFLTPSINLAHEKLDIPFDQYLKEIRTLHAKDGIINLGLIETRSGKAHLFSFINKTPSGEMELLQAFISGQKEVFVLTTAAEKSEFIIFKDQFLSALKSLQLTEDLFSLLPEPESSALKQRIKSIPLACTQKDKERSYAAFEKFVLSHFDSLGDYWKLLILQEGYKAAH